MNRREFIQTSTLFTVAAAAGFDAMAAKKLKTFGCQLYSVRDQMSKDPIATMRTLAAQGYRQFESYSKDPFWGMSTTEVKAFLKEINVDMVSAHLGMADITDEMAAKAKEVGLKYLICPYIGPQKSEEEWKKRAEEFNKAGRLCQKYGLKFGYHNHAYSFEEKNGVKGQNVLLAHTDPTLVIFELDIYWAEVAGEDAIAHLQKHKGRYELCHVKQIAKKDPKPEQGILKGGLLDFQKILKAGKKSGLKYFLVEQEQYVVDSISDMKANAEYMSNLKL